MEQDEHAQRRDEDGAVVCEPAPPAVAPQAAGQLIDLRFTGSGWEYFRIWVVNLLLTLVTFGIYYPWARVRKLRYVYANTVVDGDALTYHATGLQLFGGMVVAGIGIGLLNLIGRLSPIAGMVTTLIIWALVPWFWRSAMRFRLSQTSWRGLRFRFTGSTGGAYAALGGSGVLFIGVIAAAAGLAVWVLKRGETQGLPGITEIVTFVLVLVVVLAVVSAVGMAWIRRYQHNHYAFGDMGVRMDVSWQRVVGAGFWPVLLGLAVLAATFGATIALGFAPQGADAQEARTAAVVRVLSGVATVYLLAPLIAAFLVARYQNLFWSATHNDQLRFNSNLSPWRYTGLVAVSVILTMLTLGLYWPFAAMRLTRARVQAMSVQSTVDWATVQAAATANGNSLGDMAMDMEGMDFGM